MSYDFGAPKTTAGGGFSFPTLTTSTAGTSSSTSGFSFGTALTSQSTSASPFSFGTTPAATTTGGGVMFTPTGATSQPSALPTGGGFLATPASSGTSTFSFSSNAPAATTASGGFSSGFQLPTTTTQAAAAAAAAPPPTLQFGGPTKPLGAAPEPAKSAAPTLQGFAFPTKPATGSSLFTPAVTSTTPAAAPTTTNISSFPSLTPSQTSVPSSGTTTTTTTTATTLLGLVPPVASTAPATTTLPVAPTPLTTSTPFASLTTATSTSSAAITASSGSNTGTGNLSVAGLEEKVNKWMSELREQEERLMRQAAHVNAWDQLLQQGHDQVQQLRLTLNNVKTDQNRLQAELDFIQGQQKELEQLIEPLEAAAASTTPAQHQGDRQRENMHLVAQNLDSQLRQITDDLCKVIEHLNSSNSGSQASDPVNTVARVLSAHMDTLKWVDQNTALLTQKIDELTRTSENKRKD